MSEARVVEWVKLFVGAMRGETPDALGGALREDAQLLVWGSETRESHSSRQSVLDRIRLDRAQHGEREVELLSSWCGDDRAVLEFRIYSEDPSHFAVEENRCAIVEFEGGSAHTINLYCSGRVPSTRRRGKRLSASTPRGTIARLLDTIQFSADLRDRRPCPWRDVVGANVTSWGNGSEHPMANWVLGARFRVEDADERIEEIVEKHRVQGAGFIWRVGPNDTPVDLAQRLIEHGFVRAGSIALMARCELAPDDIPVNHDVVVELATPDRHELMDQICAVEGACFGWADDEAIVEFARKRLELPGVVATERNYLATIDGTPVGYGRLRYSSGIATLEGAATLEGHRRKGVYATLLYRRLADAHADGLQIAGIQAFPDSQPVLEKYGFERYAEAEAFCWMPKLDMEVVESLLGQ